MSLGDMFQNQLDLDMENRVVVDRDKYNDHRVQRSLHNYCPKCGCSSNSPCRPMTDYQRKISGQWIHVDREETERT